MISNRDYSDRFIRNVDRAIDGKAFFIENPYDRLGNVFNLMRDRFTLIGSTSGAGKTSFTDDLFILKPFTIVQGMKDVHFEVLYYSMERKKDYKYAKWASWMLYRDHKIQVSADKLLGFDSSGPIDDDMYKKLRSYDNEMSELLDAVHIYDGRTTTETISRHIRTRAKALGSLYMADSVGVMKDYGKEYIAVFSEDQTRDTRVGKEMYVEIDHEGEKFTLTKDTHRYFYKNPNTVLFIVIDGIGLITKGKGQSTKGAIDDTIDLLADARDIFGFSPVVISQFNRQIADIHRKKHSGPDLAPQESDFKDSANHYQAADVVLALFDPYKFSAFDGNGEYKGYSVSNMISPLGHSRLRTLHVLKNTFGISEVFLGMKFVGESNWFETLPKPSDPGLSDIYSQIKLNK